MSDLTPKQSALITLAQYAETLSASAHPDVRAGIHDAIADLFREEFPAMAKEAALKASLIRETERRQLNLHLLFKEAKKQ